MNILREIKLRKVEYRGIANEIKQDGRQALNLAFFYHTNLQHENYISLNNFDINVRLIFHARN